MLNVHIVEINERRTTLERDTRYVFQHAYTERGEHFFTEQSLTLEDCITPRGRLLPAAWNEWAVRRTGCVRLMGRETVKKI